MTHSRVWHAISYQTLLNKHTQHSHQWSVLNIITECTAVKRLELEFSLTTGSMHHSSIFNSFLTNKLQRHRFKVSVLIEAKINIITKARDKARVQTNVARARHHEIAQLTVMGKAFQQIRGGSRLLGLKNHREVIGTMAATYFSAKRASGQGTWTDRSGRFWSHWILLLKHNIR